MCWTHGNSATAIRRLTPECAIAIRNVSPLGIPSDTNAPANHIVPVVPIFAPRTAATAAGKGTAPDATSAMIAVVDNDDDCHSSVIMIPPRNIQYGLWMKNERWSILPIDFIPPENIFKPI